MLRQQNVLSRYEKPSLNHPLRRALGDNTKRGKKEERREVNVSQAVTASHRLTNRRLKFAFVVGIPNSNTQRSEMPDSKRPHFLTLIH